MQRSIGTNKLMLSIFLLLPWLATIDVNAQIVPASDGTGTTTQQNQNQINISGGQTSQGGSNLFHSFSQFNVNSGQVANFISTPNIQNILGRINGGDASLINGMLQVTGGNSNLFLMNPAGIVFGANASLNLPASFTTTTATGINFGNGQFNAIGTNNYADLFGNPTAFTFGLTQPGAIVNGSNLTVSSGQNIDLIGGTVISTGTVNAPGGNINIAAVPGNSLVRISQPGNLLSLEISTGTTNFTSAFTPATLPILLTGRGVPGVTVSGNNVTLDRTNVPINSGDIVVDRLKAGTATVAANNNLNLIGSNLTTTGDVTLRAQNTVAIKDTQQQPLNITVDGRLLIQGDRQIDIFALNNPTSNISASGNLTLRSSATVGGDAYFNTGGNFKIEQLDGTLGNLFSPYDPIIRASGDVSFGDYQGASLHIIAGGSVTTGNITITSPDVTTSLRSPTGSIPNGLVESFTLADGTSVSINGITNPTLDIRAGTTAFGMPDVLSSNTAFNPTTTATPTGSAITVGNINFSGSASNRPFVLLTNQYFPNTSLAAGDISVGTINTLVTASTSTDPSSPSNNVVASGDITIVGRNNVNVSQLETGFNDTNFTGATNTGNILVRGIGDITATGLISTRNARAATTGSGNITLTSANGKVTTNGVSTITNDASNNGNSTNIRSGNINITAAGAIDTTRGDLSTRAQSSNRNPTTISSGDIALNSTGGNIATNRVTTSSSSDNSTNTQSGNISITAAGAIDTSRGDLETGLASNDISATTNTRRSGNIVLTSSNGPITTERVSTNISSGNSTSRSGDINITAAGAIDTTRGAILSDIFVLATPNSNITPFDSPPFNGISGNISLISTTSGVINTTKVATTGGSIDIRGKGNVNIPLLAVRVNRNVPSSSSNITVNTTGDITAGLIFNENINNAPSGNISLTSTNGQITATDRISTQLGNVTIFSNDFRAVNPNINVTDNFRAGDININAANAIVTRDIRTGSISPDANHTGGNIGLISTNSSIETGNLSTGITSRGNAGTVSANARTNITNGNIVTTSNAGNGGNVTLVSGNDLSVGYIDTSARLNGGLIDITASRFFRATDSTNVNLSPTPTPSASPSPVLVSIYSNGNTASGAITIRYGGNGVTPFIVGDATTNGVKDSIVSSNNNQIAPTQSLLSSSTKGNIQIITTTPPPICPPNCPQPPVTPLVTITPEDPPGEIKELDRIATIKIPGLQEFNKNISVAQTQEIFRDIESKTGTKPAIIYAVFSPANLGLDIGTDINNISNSARDNFQLEIIMVTSTGAPVRRTIPVNRKKMLQIAKKFGKEVIDPKKPTAFLANAQQLYQWLIAPLENDLQQRKIQNLVFIMEGGLRSIPMAALHDGKQFLVERYSIGAMPSLSLTDTRYVDIRKAQVLAMGAENIPTQAPLPAVPIELSTISGTIWAGKSFQNEQFTAKNLVAQRQQQPFSILHLATHGEFQAGKIQNSYIQLWDERLQIDRLRQLNLSDPPVELMVLSACRTALGNEDAELGFAGLANRAGVKSAMGSLWYVSDEGTLGLMTSFYRNLKTAPIKAEALRQAQIAMLKGKVRLQNGKLITPGDKIDLPPSIAKLGNVNLSHPFYWSGFTIVGSPW